MSVLVLVIDLLQSIRVRDEHHSNSLVKILSRVSITCKSEIALTILVSCNVGLDSLITFLVIKSSETISVIANPYELLVKVLGQDGVKQTELLVRVGLWKAVDV